MVKLIKDSRKMPNWLPGRKKPRPIDCQDMNESMTPPASDSVFEISENFASTLTAKRKRLPATSKSILKRKCQDASLSSPKRSKQTKITATVFSKNKKT